MQAGNCVHSATLPRSRTSLGEPSLFTSFPFGADGLLAGQPKAKLGSSEFGQMDLLRTALTHDGSQMYKDREKLGMLAGSRVLLPSPLAPVVKSPTDFRRSKLLILIRHAESRLNATRKEHMAQPWNIIRNGIGYVIDPGVKDAPLTSTGYKQAERAGKRLCHDIELGRLPPIQLVAVSPLRRTLHTARLISDAADTENTNLRWWELNNSRNPFVPPQRHLMVLPFLRECRTTSADKPCVKPEKAVEFWADRHVNLDVVRRSDVGPLEFDAISPRIRTRLNHYLTVGITKPCRKVKVETPRSVHRRVQLLEAWLASQEEDVILLVGHNMIFKNWQSFWLRNSPNVRWARRSDLLGDLEKQAGMKKRASAPALGCCETGTNPTISDVDKSSSTAASSSCLTHCVFEELLLERGHQGRRVLDCANTECLVVRWTPSEAIVQQLERNEQRE